MRLEGPSKVPLWTVWIWGLAKVFWLSKSHVFSARAQSIKSWPWPWQRPAALSSSHPHEISFTKPHFNLSGLVMLGIGTWFFHETWNMMLTMSSQMTFVLECSKPNFVCLMLTWRQQHFGGPDILTVIPCRLAGRTQHLLVEECDSHPDGSRILHTTWAASKHWHWTVLCQVTSHTVGTLVFYDVSLSCKMFFELQSCIPSDRVSNV